MVRIPGISRQSVLLVVATGVALVLVAQRLNLGALIERSIDFFREAGPVPFFLAMALLPAIGFPVWPFLTVAGPVFAPRLGAMAVIGCSLTALMANMAMCYWIAARGLRPWLQRVLTARGYRVPRIPGGSEWEVTLVFRVIPGPPFFLQNYLLGLARLPFGIYLTVSLAVQAVFAIGMVTAGEAFARRDPRAIAVSVAFFAVVGFAAHRLRKRFGRAATATWSAARSS